MISRTARATAAAAAVLLSAAPPVGAQTATGASGLRVVDRIAGPDGGWDYAGFDPARRRVYVAHGMQVTAIDADTRKVTATFAAGNHLHAVLPIPGQDLLLTTNSGDDSARLYNAASGALVASIRTAKDPDAAIFDGLSGLAYVMGGESGTITVINVKKAKAVGSIAVGGALEFAALDGKGRLFVNREDKADIAVVDVATRKVTGHYPLAGCGGPTGLAYVQGGRLISACMTGVAKILDAATGREIASLKIGPRPDAVIYDAARGLAYIPSAIPGALAVIALSGAANNTIIDTVPTQAGARTGALDEKTGRIYLPTADYGPPPTAGDRPTVKPGTFTVLVLDRPPA